MTFSPSKKFKTNQLIPPSASQTNQFSTEFPQHLIFICILPRLSYKILSKFKCVGKTWNKIISKDAKFAEDQSLCASSFSCGTVFSNCYGNKVQFFNTFDSPIGFDQSHHHLFANCKMQCRRILASSCGLLCILFHKYADFAYQITSYYLYVGNLATGVGEVIPLPYQTREYNIGLAFDPLIEPNCYQLVQPLQYSNIERKVIYEFNVYSNKTCKWVRIRSKGRIGEIKSFYGPRKLKPITLKNVVYWDCYKYIISFDPWKDVGTYIELPKLEKSSYQQELGTCNGLLTYTSLNSSCMEVYVLDNSQKIWELKHKVSFDMMFNSNRDMLLGFWHSLGNTSNRFLERLFLVYRVYPFPYEGGNMLYFRISTKKAEYVLSYDLRFEKVTKFCEFQVMDSKRDDECAADQHVFTYHNSMVKVPVCQASNKGQRIFL